MAYSVEPMPDGTALCSNGNVVGHFDDAALAQHVANLLNRENAAHDELDAETPGPGRPCAAALVRQSEGGVT